MVKTCQDAPSEEPWVEYGYNDPKEIPWEKFKEALEILGIDTTNGGAQFIELHAHDRRVQITRTRRSVDGRYAMWTITKEIMIR